MKITGEENRRGPGNFNSGGREEPMDTPIGRMTMTWKGGKLKSLRLPSRIPGVYPVDEAACRDWARIISLGNFRPDLEPYGEFIKQVWLQAAAIPWGATESYGRLARRIGRPRAGRAVGAALGMNPWPLLIPCHRVIRADGSIGGFTAGPAWKSYLIELERRTVER